MLAPLDHESILHLYGVILPGLYTDSVALVSTVLFLSGLCSPTCKLTVPSASTVKPPVNKHPWDQA